MYAVYLGECDCDDLVRWKRSVCAGKWSLGKIINIRVSACIILTFRTRNQSWPAKVIDVVPRSRKQKQDG